MADQRRLSFGIKTSQAGVAYDDIERMWLAADAVEVIEHAWLWDHMVPLRGPVTGAALEAWTLLSALAALTKRLRFGVLVTSNRLRAPALLAKMAATVDVISGGRLDFGIGAGGCRGRGVRPDLVETVGREHEAYGIPLVPCANAIGALGEACTLAKRLWTASEPFDFDGRHYQLRGAVCEPKPVQRPHPPILIGGIGERLTLRVVAEHADIWNCPLPGVEQFRHYNNVLDEHCAAIGRDPHEITRSVQMLLRDEDPAKTRDVLTGFIEAGATHLVLAPLPPYRPVRQIADEIIAPLLTA
jgi:alkanesulfonate monooxygenase SsuD/methylene tetrahydromethanopterin reductase-like flavin-dependent oxidoreductase (luciferase family)